MQSIIVTADELRAAVDEASYKARLSEPNVFPSRENWAYITDRAMGSLARLLVRKYLVAWMTPEDERTDYHDAALDCLPGYLRAIARPRALEAVYADTVSAPGATVHLVHECLLFDAARLMAMADNGQPGTVADCLTALQPVYTPADLQPMSMLAVTMENLPRLGSVRTVKGIFGEQKKFECPRGHANDIAVEYCTHPGCGLRMDGLNKRQALNVEKYRTNIDTLRDLLTQHAT